jgi:hypothetical protein
MKRHNKSNHALPLTDQELEACLSPCPKAGNGVHRYIFRAACHLWRLGADDINIIRLLRKAVCNCGREVEDEEIESAVYNAEEVERSPDPKRKWPKPHQRLIHYVTNSRSAALELLKSSSPVDPGGKAPLDFVDELIPGKELLCFASNPKNFWTKDRDAWTDDGRLRFMVPSPMSAIRGRTKAGRKSFRCLDNTGPRKYLVIEFDSGTQEQQAGLILHLAERAPLVMVVFSGKKSLHAWFHCADQTEENLRTFMEYAVSLGADRATWCRCQLVRVPAAKRDNGNEQTVYFFNPSGAKVASAKLAGEWDFERLETSETDLLGLEIYFDPEKQNYFFPANNG